MSLTFEQILAHEEDHTVFLFNGSDLVAACIYAGIKCKTFPTLPRNANIIAEKVTQLYLREFERVSNDYYCRVFESYSDLCDWLDENLKAIPEIRELNLRQREYDLGYRVDAVDAEESVGVDARPDFPRVYDVFTPEEDFIDVDAYVSYVARVLIRNKLLIKFSTFPGARHYRSPINGQCGAVRAETDTVCEECCD